MRRLTPDELVADIAAVLTEKAPKATYGEFRIAPDPTPPASFALIVGAGFSHGVVPLVRELMHQTIGGYYFPDQEGRDPPPGRLRKDSARFWKEFNKAADEAGLPCEALDRNGLPADPAGAYVKLFTYEGATALFAMKERERMRGHKPTYVERLRALAEARGAFEGINDPEPDDAGERFVNGFLRYVTDPGYWFGYGSPGRSELNVANVYLAALLEAQQMGTMWRMGPFCRLIVTTNFDTLLQNALQFVNILYAVTDRPDAGLGTSDFAEEETAIHVVYAHGSILRHNPASTIAAMSALTEKNDRALCSQLERCDIVTVGYSGWNDGIMSALRQCDPSRQRVFWCDVRA